MAKKLFSWSALTLSVLLFFSCGQVRFSGNNNSTDSGAGPNGGGNDGGGGGTNPPIDQSQTRDVVYNGAVQPKTSKVDILLIIDDSNSMLEDNKKLASRLAGFVSVLQEARIDWQMCVTLTRQLNINNNLYWGASVNWVNYTPSVGTPTWVLKAGPNNLAQIFNSTIENIGAGWAGTDDERGIKAAYWHVSNSPHNSCYRGDAAFSTILISDEDERSVGGDASAAFYPNELKTLEEDDLPENFVAHVKQVFGDSKRFTFNSIVVKDKDKTCMASQDSAGSKSHYGRKYQSLSSKTGGGVGSICDSDFSTSLKYFNQIIENSLGSLPLECEPVNGNVSVTITPPMGNVQTTVQGMNLVFNPSITSGHTLNVKYKCAGLSSARAPSSETSGPGFWARVYSILIEPILNLFK